jgi:hypothetical protein
MQRSISGRAWDVVAGFEVAYATTAGDQIRVRLESVPPVRRGSSYRGQRHLSGRWLSATDGRHVGSESWLERDLMLLDFDPTVIAIGSQPFWLRWSEGSGRPVARRHRDRAPCHADVVQPVGVAVIDSRERPAITGRCCTGQLGVAKRRGCDRKS